MTTIGLVPQIDRRAKSKTPDERRPDFSWLGITRQRNLRSRNRLESLGASAGATIMMGLKFQLAIPLHDAATDRSLLQLLLGPGADTTNKSGGALLIIVRLGRLGAKTGKHCPQGAPNVLRGGVSWKRKIRFASNVDP